MKRSLTFLMLIFIPFGSAYAQDEEKEELVIYRPKYEFGLYTGTLILAKIPEVIDNVPPVVLKLGMQSTVGFFEVSLLHARGNDMRWRSGMIDYRFNLDELQIPFHVLFGFQADIRM